MEPPIPIGSMHSIFAYTQVTFFHGKPSQIYQPHQLSGLFFDPTLSSTPHGEKQPSQRIHSTFAEATRSHWPHDIWRRSSLDPLRRKRRGAKVGRVLVLTGWWLNQPIWKICSWSWESSPRFGVKMKNIWNHNLVEVFWRWNCIFTPEVLPLLRTQKAITWTFAASF